MYQSLCVSVFVSVFVCLCVSMCVCVVSLQSCTLCCVCFSCEFRQ